MNNKIKHNLMNESHNSNTHHERIDNLSFIFSSLSEPFPAELFEVQMQNIMFCGTISTDKLATTIRDCFSRYFSGMLKSKKEINTIDFMDYVNNVISPSSLTSIGEIKFKLIAESVREAKQEKSASSKTSQWHYELMPMINGTNKEPSIAQDNLTPTI